MIRLLLALFLFSSISQVSASVQLEDMIAEFEMMKYTLHSNYAPMEWKVSHHDLNLDRVQQLCLTSIQNKKVESSHHFHMAINQFFGSLRDYHVKAVFYDRSLSLFPLKIKEANGKYFITSTESRLLSLLESVERQVLEEVIEKWEKELRYTLPFGEFPFEVGDQVLAVNGVSINTYIDQLVKEEFFGDDSLTGRSLATESVFCRMGKYGQKTPSGQFSITVYHQKSKKAKSYQLPWIHYKEDVLIRNFVKKEFPCFLNSQDSFCVGYANDLLCEEAPSKKRRLPPLGRVLWQTTNDSQIYGYLYLTKSLQLVGYVQIPTFTLSEEQVEDFRKVIEVLKVNSEALVIDLTNNPGGFLLKMYDLLSMLTDEPLELFLAKEKILPSDVYNAMYSIAEIQELAKTQEEKDNVEALLSYYTDIVDSYQQGKEMTGLHYYYGMSAIHPHPTTHYDQPILVLINELDFSCGDLFPAILQDNGRAKLFGQKTAGAGGSVTFYPCNSRFGVRGYSLTRSFLYRLDGKTPIEDLGVSPDIPYKLTERDLTENYVDYREAVNKEVLNLIKGR